MGNLHAVAKKDTQIDSGMSAAGFKSRYLASQLHKGVCSGGFLRRGAHTNARCKNKRIPRRATIAPMCADGQYTSPEVGEGFEGC